MNRLREIADRPIPLEQGLAVFAGAAVTLLVAAAVLIAIPGRDPGDPASDPVAVQAPPVEPDRIGELENQVETAARRFMDGYLPLISGQGNPRQIRAASPKLIEKLASQVRVSPAARNRHPRPISTEVGSVSTGRASAAVTVETDGITYPVILNLRRVAGRWLVERVGVE